MLHRRLLQDIICVDGHSLYGAHHELHTMLMVSWCHSECYVPSGLNFEAAGGSGVHSCLSNYLLWGHWVAVNMTWVLFGIKVWRWPHILYYLVWLFAVEVHVTYQPTPDSNRQSTKHSKGEWPPISFCNYTSPYGSWWHSKAYSHGSDYTRLGLTSQNGTLASVNASSCQQRHHNRERKATQCYYVLCKIRICSLLFTISKKYLGIIF